MINEEKMRRCCQKPVNIQKNSDPSMLNICCITVISLVKLPQATEGQNVLLLVLNIYQSELEKTAVLQPDRDVKISAPEVLKQTKLPASREAKWTVESPSETYSLTAQR